MASQNLREWEKRLKLILDKLDDLFEDKYGADYRLHPVRAKRGKTSNKASDGLFNITPKFTLGHGSEHGEGYVVDIHLSTLQKVESNFKESLKEEAQTFLQSELNQEFGKTLTVSFDTTGLKIHGDLSL